MKGKAPALKITPLSTDNSIFIIFTTAASASLATEKKMWHTSGPLCNLKSIKKKKNLRCSDNNWRGSHSLSASTLIMKPYGHPQCSRLSGGPRILRCLKSVASVKKRRQAGDGFSMTDFAEAWNHAVPLNKGELWETMPQSYILREILHIASLFNVN